MPRDVDKGPEHRKAGDDDVEVDRVIDGHPLPRGTHPPDKINLGRSDVLILLVFGCLLFCCLLFCWFLSGCRVCLLVVAVVFCFVVCVVLLLVCLLL